MKNVLLKFAGFFVEKVPVEHPPAQRTAPRNSPAGAGRSQQQQQPPQRQAPVPPHLMHGHFPSPSGTTAHPRREAPPTGPAAPAQARPQPVAVALRAWVPQEYQSYLVPFGVHVIAAGGELRVEDAVAYGAQVLVVASECLGGDTHLLTNPKLPTVFIAPQSMLIPQRPGVVQVLEPLRASEVAAAVREALQAWPS